MKQEVFIIEVEEKKVSDKIRLSKVKITNKQGEEAIGKPKGTYITIDIKKLKLATDEDIENAANVLSENLKELVNLHVQSMDDVLVVGLGNEYITPDSLRS